MAPLINTIDNIKLDATSVLWNKQGIHVTLYDKICLKFFIFNFDKEGILVYYYIIYIVYTHTNLIIN